MTYRGPCPLHSNFGISIVKLAENVCRYHILANFDDQPIPSRHFRNKAIEKVKTGHLTIAITFTISFHIDQMLEVLALTN